MKAWSVAVPLLRITALHLLTTACAMVVSHAKEPSGERAQARTEAPMEVALVAKTLFGYNSAARDRAEDDPDLRALLVEELERSETFVPCSSDKDGAADLRLEVLFREADDAGNMEGGMLAALTFWLIPVWYDRELVTEVTATSRDGQTRTFTESDDYTTLMWMPAWPLGLFWSRDRAFRDLARNQFGRVLEQL